MGISEGGEGVSSVAAAAGVSLAGALGSGGGAVLGAGASLGGASPEQINTNSIAKTFI